MGFNVVAARKAGYTDAEIADFLAKESRIDITAARESGWDDRSIIRDLNGAPKPRAGIEPQFRAERIDPSSDLGVLKRAPTPEQLRSVAGTFPLLIDDVISPVTRQALRDTRAQAAKDRYRAAHRPRGARTTPEQTKSEVDTSAGGAFGRAATRSAIPTAAGIAGAEGGAMLFAPTGPATLGVGPLLGGAGFGLLGAYGASKAQESVLDRLPEDYRAKLGFGHEQQIADAEHPYATFAGGVLPGYAFGRPTKALFPTLAGGALGGLIEGGREVIRGDIDPGLIAEGVLAGATQTKGYGLSRVISGPKDTGIEHAIREHRPPLGDARTVASDIRALGEQPRPVDVLSPAITSHLGNEATTGSLEARDLLRKYAEDTQAATPAVARRNVDKIAPTDTRTGEEAAAQAAQEALDAQERLRPGVTAEKARADQLYAEARSKGVAQLQRRPEPQGESEGWARMTPEEEARLSQDEDTPPISNPWINRKTGEVIPETQYRDRVRAQGPGPEVAAILRGSISGYALRPGDIEGTARLLADADGWSTVDTSNLYGLRDSLGELERRYPGTPDAGAAATARHALDAFMTQADAEGRFTGDPEVVSANRAAIGNWRNFRQRYDDSTLIGRLTQQEYRGSSLQPVQDPQTAGQSILGSLKESGDRVRDLQELRDRLGADSPEWMALRREAMDRVAGPSKDDPNYLAKIRAWREANPRLAELIMGAEGDRALSEARVATTDVEGRQEAMAAGADFLGRETQDFTRDVAAMSPRARRDAIATARQTIRDGLTTPQSSISMLDRIATNPTAQANLRQLLPLQEALRAVSDAQAILRRVKASQAPLQGAGAPESAEALATDIGRIGGAMHGPVGRAMSNAFMDVMRGKGSPSIRRREATQLARDLLDPEKAQATMMFVDQMAGQNGVQRVLGVMRQGAASRLDALVRLGRIPAAWAAGEAAQAHEPGKMPSGSAAEDVPIEQKMTDEELDAIIGSAGEAGSNGPGMPGSKKGGKNNPGNVRDYPWAKKQPGYIGGGGPDGFADFDTPESGAAAQKTLLSRHYLGKGFDTPAKIVDKYLGNSAENTPAERRNYKVYVARRLGIGINDPVPVSRLGELAQYMREVEQNERVSSGR